MHSIRWTLSCLLLTLAAVLYGAVALFAQPPGDAQAEVATDEKADADQGPDDVKRVTVEAARERAKLAHSIYSATLDVVHREYFHGERETVPARAMEDVFARIGWKENLKARWFSVNAPPMSIDHKPKDDFEKQAAKAIAAGKSEYEAIDDGVYRRAEGISLMGKGCLRCHLQLNTSGRIHRFAGLAISIPVIEE